jgi:hypothetical protein
MCREPGNPVGGTGFRCKACYLKPYLLHAADGFGEWTWSIVGPLTHEVFDGRGKDQFNYGHCQYGLWTQEKGGYNPENKLSFSLPYFG